MRFSYIIQGLLVAVVGYVLLKRENPLRASGAMLSPSYKALRSLVSSPGYRSLSLALRKQFTGQARALVAFSVPSENSGAPEMPSALHHTGASSSAQDDDDESGLLDRDITIGQYPGLPMYSLPVAFLLQFILSSVLFSFIVFIYDQRDTRRIGGRIDIPFDLKLSLSFGFIATSLKFLKGSRDPLYNCSMFKKSNYEKMNTETIHHEIGLFMSHLKDLCSILRGLYAVASTNPSKNIALLLHIKTIVDIVKLNEIPKFEIAFKVCQQRRAYPESIRLLHLTLIEVNKELSQYQTHINSFIATIRPLESPDSPKNAGSQGGSVESAVPLKKMEDNKSLDSKIQTLSAQSPQRPSDPKVRASPVQSPPQQPSGSARPLIQKRVSSSISGKKLAV